jgi:hypothetical protein
VARLRPFVTASLASALVVSGMSWAPSARGDDSVFHAGQPPKEDDPTSPPTLPAPRLVPELSLGKDQANDQPMPADTWSSRRRTIAVSGGSAGGPLGYGGAVFEYAPSRYFVAGAGSGIGPGGVTAAILPRLRLPLTRFLAIGFGLPFSGGPYEYSQHVAEQCTQVGCGPGYRTTRDWNLAFFVHVEPNVEFRFRSGIALRLYGGESVIVNPHDDKCTSTLASGCPSSIGEKTFYGGLAVGYAF